MSLELSGTTPAIKGVAGSVSAPAITGDDVDTGISFPSANTIKFSTNGVERMSITDSGVTGTGIGAGKIIQVVQTTKTDSFSYGTLTTEFDITGMSVTITPSASSSKILVTASINYGGSANTYAGIILKDNSTGSFDYTFRADTFTANNGAAAPRFTVTADVINTYKVNNTQIEFLHIPNGGSGTTNAITYKLMGYMTYGNFILNRPYTLDNNIRTTGTSIITVREIGA